MSKFTDLCEDIISGGLGDNQTVSSLAKKHKVSEDKIREQLKKGIEVEFEHTNNRKIAKEIATDHVTEDSEYYNKLKKMENE